MGFLPSPHLYSRLVRGPPGMAVTYVSHIHQELPEGMVCTLLTTSVLIQQPARPGRAHCSGSAGNEKSRGLEAVSKLHQNSSSGTEIDVLVTVSVAAMKHHNQKASWGGKGLFGLHFQIIVHPWRKPGQELKQGRNLKAGADADGCCFLACFTWLTQPASL